MTLLTYRVASWQNLTACVQLNTCVVYFVNLISLSQENCFKYMVFFSIYETILYGNFRFSPKIFNNLVQFWKKLFRAIFFSFLSVDQYDTFGGRREQRESRRGHKRASIETKSRPRSRGRNTFFHEEDLERRGWPEASSRMKRSHRETYKLWYGVINNTIILKRNSHRRYCRQRWNNWAYFSHIFKTLKVISFAALAK